MLAEERAERDWLAAALREALAYATPTQARRVCAYYLDGLTQQQIADRERVHSSNLFQRIYEDMVSGKLSEERYSKLSATYEAEQHALSDSIKLWRAELETEQAHVKQETARHGPYFLCGDSALLSFRKVTLNPRIFL